MPAGMFNTREFLATLRRKELLDTLDLRLVESLAKRVNARAPFPAVGDVDAFIVVTAALCRACAEGSLCLPLAGEDLEAALRGLLAAAETVSGDDFAGALAARCRAGAEAGRFAAALGTPDAPRPLVRAHDRLYLHRFCFAERAIAEGLAARARDAVPIPAATIHAVLRETLEAQPLRATDGSPLRLTEKQGEALSSALREPVFLLSGGPGTGKTTWTAAWLRAVLRLPGVSPDRVRLCAPTGRAARRLEDSLERAIPVTTLHTLLGYRAFEGRFARGPEDPIDADWILLDEASMADVFLVAALVRALRPGARLVLAGDPDQLPAVEAGSVLSELLAGPLPSVILDTGHRSSGAVSLLAGAARTGDADAVLKTLGAPLAAAGVFASGQSVGRVEPGEQGPAALAELMRAYARAVFGAVDSAQVGYEARLQRFRTLTRAEEPAALEALWNRAGRARVLAPLRRGPVSAERANRLLRELLEPAWRRPGDGPGAGFHGAPILITRNDERAGLSNGDVGLWLETGDGAAVFFPRPDRAEGWLRLPVGLLPPHELGFASTVHKSQGSEYDTVLLLLPEPGNRLLTRETLYTAVTRARGAVYVFGPEAALREATENRLRRDSGLRFWFAGVSDVSN